MWAAHHNLLEVIALLVFAPSIFTHRFALHQIEERGQTLDKLIVCQMCALSPNPRAADEAGTLLA